MKLKKLISLIMSVIMVSSLMVTVEAAKADATFDLANTSTDCTLLTHVDTYGSNTHNIINNVDDFVMTFVLQTNASNVGAGDNANDYFAVWTRGTAESKNGNGNEYIYFAPDGEQTGGAGHHQALFITDGTNYERVLYTNAQGGVNDDTSFARYTYDLTKHLYVYMWIMMPTQIILSSMWLTIR